MRKLASIQKILAIDPIPNADAIEVATILGWKVVVKKGEFQPGDLCIYAEIDSLFPARPEFDFLANKGYRIKTMRLRGQLSQGICFPLSILPADFSDPQIGDDVTEALGITKWEPKIPAVLGGDARGLFPSQIPKTDETRLQSAQGVLEELRSAGPFYITVKIDGTSSTFANIEGDVHVCSRNLSMRDREDNLYWRIYRKYRLNEVLDDHGYPLNRNLAIQGEIAGPDIQKNPLRLKEHQLFVFGIFDIAKGEYFDFENFMGFCDTFSLPTVPILSYNNTEVPNLEGFLKMAEGNYDSGIRREGIVVRPMVETFSPTLNNHLSFKVINNEYLLKNEE